jgi:acyl-CoA dehydrogenase
MSFSLPTTPLDFLRQALGPLSREDALRAYQDWWQAEGLAVSAAVDRAGTPWLRQCDRWGARVDEIAYAPDYWRMLKTGYRAGAVWPAFAGGTLRDTYLAGYVTAFHDPGLYCPYTVSLGTAAALDKYGAPDVRARFLPQLVRQDDAVWQGATWMTEAGGGSDLGATVACLARQAGEHWLLTGDKYFASNAGAELAVVAARPAGAPAGVRGLALFLVPRRRADGALNYTIRRMKDKTATRSVPTGEVELRDSEGYLLGAPGQGIYLILEVLNLSRTANSIGSVALGQRALVEALTFAQRRTAFGRALVDQPLMRRQFEERARELAQGFALAWESVTLLGEVWREAPPYSPRFHLFRLIVHLAKYWTAEWAVQAAKWAMEVNGGMGVLGEYGVERWLREAMVLDIWEGPPHRQMLDGLEVMARKGAHRQLWEQLSGAADAQELAEWDRRITAHLALAPEEQEAGVEPLFRELASFTAKTLVRRGRSR